MAASTKGIRAGRAFVELFADDSKLVRGLRRAEKRLKAFGDGVRNLGLKVAGIGTAILAPLAASAKLFSSYGDQVAKMAKRTGLSTEALSELRFVASQTGTEFESLEMGFRKMQRSIYDAGRGLSTQVDALKDLGLTFEDLDGLSPEDQFKRLADRIGKIEDPTRKAAIAMTLFGRTGTNLLPMFAAGSQGIEALQAEARRLGLTMSGKDAKAAEEFTDALDRLWKVVKMGTFNIGAALAPVLQRVAETITRVAVTVSAWIKQNRQLIVQVLKVAAIVTAAGAALIVLGTLISGIGAAIGVLASIITGVGVAFGVLASAIGLLISPIGLVVAAVGTLGVVLLKTSGAGAVALAWLGEKFEALKETALRAWRGVADALAAGDIALAARVLWMALRVQWLKGVQYLKGLWLGFKTNFLQVATEAFYGAVKLAAGAWAGLRAAWVQTVAFLKKAWTTFTSTLASAHRIAVGFVEKQLHRLRGAFDETYDVEAAIAISQSNQRADLQRIEGDKQSDLAASEQQRQQQLATIGQEFEDTAKALDEAAAEATERQRQAAQAEMDAATADLEQARREYQAALDEAASKRAASDRSGDRDSSLQSLFDRLEGLGDQLNAAAERTISVRGTFNAAAIQGLQTSNLDERIAEASETTAANTSRLVRDSRRNAQPAFT